VKPREVTPVKTKSKERISISKVVLFGFFNNFLFFNSNISLPVIIRSPSYLKKTEYIKIAA
jgi:hypothetical protein